jgi:peptidoglycan/LPS O-acetylase OafA/YrhL
MRPTVTYSPERSALRGIGASGVVAEHACQLISLGVGGAGGILALVGNVGWIGVELFLGLSVFLLMGSLDANYDLRRYFRRRIVRIWPLYFATCGLLYLTFDPNPTDLFYNLTFMAIWFPSHGFQHSGGWPATYVVWTLQLEECAYLTFPLVARLKHRARLALGVVLIATSLYGIWGAWDYFTAGPWLVCYGFGLLAYEWEPIRTYRTWSVVVFPFAFVLGWPTGLVLAGPMCAWVIACPPGCLAKWPLIAVGECSYALYLLHLWFMEQLGLLGLPVSYVVAWAVESIQRGREMRRRVAAVMTNYGGNR